MHSSGTGATPLRAADVEHHCLGVYKIILKCVMTKVAFCINSCSHYQELLTVWRGLTSRQTGSTSSKSMELAHKDQWMLHSQLNKHRCMHFMYCCIIIVPPYYYFYYYLSFLLFKTIISCSVPVVGELPCL